VVLPEVGDSHVGRSRFGIGLVFACAGRLACSISGWELGESLDIVLYWLRSSGWMMLLALAMRQSGTLWRAASFMLRYIHLRGERIR